MAQNKTRFQIIAEALGFGKVNKKVKTLQGSLKRFALGLVSVTAAYKGFGFAVDSVKMAGKLEGIEKGFGNLSKQAGFSANAFSKFDKALNGTVDRMTIMEQANSAMLLGIAENDDQMAEMFDTAQRLAVALGQDATFGIESLVTGLGRQSKLMLDNLGIIVDVRKANKAYAEELGITASKLTDAERKQAFINEALRQGKDLVEGIGEEQITTAYKMDQLTASISNFKTEIGEALVDSGAVEELTKYSKILITMAQSWLHNNRSASENLGIHGELGVELNKSVATSQELHDNYYALSDALNIYNNLTEKQKASVLSTGWALNALTSEQKDLLTELMGTNEWSDTIGVLFKDMASGASEVKYEMRFFRTEMENQSEVTDGIIEKNDEQIAQEERMREQRANRNQQEQTFIGLLQDKLKKLKESKILNAIVTQSEIVSNSKVLGSFAELNTAQGGSAKKTRDLTIAQAIADAYAGSARAFRDYPFPANLLVAAGSVASGMAAVENIKAAYKEEHAQYGFQGIVDEPTQFTVGEAGAEVVSVSPLEGPDNSVGGGMKFVIQGNVMTDDFVEDVLIEKLQQAVYRGAELS